MIEPIRQYPRVIETPAGLFRLLSPQPCHVQHNGYHLAFGDGELTAAVKVEEVHSPDWEWVERWMEVQA